MNNQPTPISYVAGTVAQDPEAKQTASGTIYSARLAVTRTRPAEGEKYGETEWYDVVTKNEGLGASMLRDLYKGSKIVVQGLAVSKEYNGKIQWSIWADRIGLVEWMRREQIAAPAAVTADDGLGF